MKTLKHFALAALIAVSAWAQEPFPPTSPAAATSIQAFPIYTLNVAPVRGATRQVIGVPGQTTYFYWAVTNYAVGSAVSRLGGIFAANATLSGSNYVLISPFGYPAGSSSVDILRTTTDQAPTGVCNCAVATGVTSGSIQDQSNTLSAYTVPLFNPNTYALTLTNEVVGSNSSHLILRQGWPWPGTLVADLSTGGGAGTITGATPNGGLLVTGTTLGMLTSCSSGQVEAWNGTAWACTTISSGGITGSGTVGTIPEFGSTTTSITNSPIVDGGTTGITATIPSTGEFNVTMGSGLAELLIGGTPAGRNGQFAYLGGNPLNAPNGNAFFEAQAAFGSGGQAFMAATGSFYGSQFRATSSSGGLTSGIPSWQSFDTLGNFVQAIPQGSVGAAAGVNIGVPTSDQISFYQNGTIFAGFASTGEVLDSGGFEMLFVGGMSGQAWLLNGIGFNVQAGTFTDTTSSGTVAGQAIYAFARPTLTASSATTYTNSSTLYVAGAPISGTNVTQTNPFAAYINGATFINGALTVSSCTGCGGFTNPMTTLGDTLFGGASGVATRLAGATTPNGVPQVPVSIPSGGVATAPILSLPGTVVRAVTTSTGDTIASTDCNPKRVMYTITSAEAVTLPTATTLAVPFCVFKLVNEVTSTANVTVTPTTWTINGGSTLLLLPGQGAQIYVDPSGTNWDADSVQYLTSGLTGTQTICSGTIALGTTLIASGAKSTISSTTCTGVLTSDNVAIDFASDPSAVTGYAPSANGGLTIIKFPTSNTINLYQYNDTAASITPGAMTVNYHVFR